LRAVIFSYRSQASAVLIEAMDGHEYAGPSVTAEVQVAGDAWWPRE